MPETLETSSNAAQIEYWNATAGEIWAQFQEPLDRQVEPLGLAAMAVLAPREGEHILDIGCGCGQTTLILAARVRPTGSVIGVDISKPMLDVALRRARPAPDLQVAFRTLDVQTSDLGHGRLDAAFSRFGVMFFGDPVAAFANIRGSLKPDGRLAYVCWRPLNENPWMQAPLLSRFGAGQGAMSTEQVHRATLTILAFSTADVMTLEDFKARLQSSNRVIKAA
jgi:ubiquinone/menaquinone biosynthesis C-methylase UbiE